MAVAANKPSTDWFVTKVVVQMEKMHESVRKGKGKLLASR
jgi:hypothetical protein